MMMVSVMAELIKVSGWAESFRLKKVPFAIRWARYAKERRCHRVQRGEYCTDRARL